MTPDLTGELQRQVRQLEDDLRERVTTQPTVLAAWQTEYRNALDRGRTAAVWEAWRDDRVTQAAVAWVLATVFVKFCEDNALVSPVWIGQGRRLQEALDAQHEFFRAHNEDTDREWLEQAVAYLASLPAICALVDEHSPLHTVSPSGDAANALLNFWRERGEHGRALRDLTEPELSTRFLGDLYQDLSQHAKDTYALLQTPKFVEEFILDRTLEPALVERPLDGFRLIDPTCGSGHFLLDTFARLLDRWHRHAPGLETQARVQAALDAIHGVDLNPFAVAIARFRLTIAALGACGLRRLEDAPAFSYHLACGDSLLHGSDQRSIDYGSGYDVDSEVSKFAYSSEDLHTLQKILRAGRYDVVVGNPPYIQVSDRALSSAYRKRYSACHKEYGLNVPFCQRFFSLAKEGGWVGQITGNQFIKRHSGLKLLNEFLPSVELSYVIDSSKTHIPGHATPTVILIGRNRRPQNYKVRVALSVNGEPTIPAIPSLGRAWSSLTRQIEQVGSISKYYRVEDWPRSRLSKQPWMLQAGAYELVEVLEAPDRERLHARIAFIGYTGQTNADGAFLASSAAVRRRGVEEDCSRQFVTGELVRDFAISEGDQSIWPYRGNELVDITRRPGIFHWLWPYRTTLWSRATFSKKTYREEGRNWWEWHQVSHGRMRNVQCIVFASTATHNHFALNVEAVRVFNRHSPFIVLQSADDGTCSGMLGLLNSSTACFWLKQYSQDKGVGGIGGGIGDEPWEPRYEFTGTTLEQLPLPEALPCARGELLDALAQQLARQTPGATCGEGTLTRERLDAARVGQDGIREQMIAVQEELDWEVYRLYGLVSEDMTYQGDDLPELALGERAFEIVLARARKAGDEETAWFDRHGSMPITEVPGHWPAGYRNLVQRRLVLIAEDPSIQLLEKPEYKRRWSLQTWEKREKAAFRSWLLDRLEDRDYWFDSQGRPLPRSVAQLADVVARDRGLVSVLALWEGRPDVPVTDSLQRLLTDEAVPYLAAYRYKESGLRKRAAWERTWELQRREDAGEQVAPIPLPPNYTSADFARKSYWDARGKLDVPKERFVSYPDAGRDTDPTPLLGWAGWDYAEQALALGRIVTERETEGWIDERLIPLVAGLAELQPWVAQWHAELHPVYGISLAAYCDEELARRCAQVGQTREQLAAWPPAPPRRGRKPAARAT